MLVAARVQNVAVYDPSIATFEKYESRTFQNFWPIEKSLNIG